VTRTGGVIRAARKWGALVTSYVGGVQEKGRGDGPIDLFVIVITSADSITVYMRRVEAMCLRTGWGS
jgi:hypothetical protein